MVARVLFPVLPRGGTRLHPQHRATIKALPHPPNRPRPYESSGLLSSFQAQVDAWWATLVLVPETSSLVLLTSMLGTAMMQAQ